MGVVSPILGFYKDYDIVISGLLTAFLQKKGI